MKRIKKGVCVLVSLLMVFSGIPVGVFAEKAEVSDATMTTMATDGNYEYTVNTDDQATITKYTGSETTVTVPETLGGKSVVGIAAGAYNDYSQLTEIEFPTTLTTINNSDTSETFGGCVNLVKVTIPSSVVNIDKNLFVDCPATLVIYGEKDSWAAGYASEYGLTFSKISWPQISTFTTSLAAGQNIKTAITLTATVTSGTAPYYYTFYYILEGNTDKVNIKESSTSNTATFTPTTAGTYALYVKVTDAAGKSSLKSIENYTVVNKPIVTLSVDKESSQYVKTDITLTAEVEDETGTEPFTYNFYSQKSGSSKESITAVDNTAVFTPTKGGTYTLSVEVVDDESLTATNSITGYVIVDELSVGSFKANKQSPQEIDTEILLTALGAGGKSGYQYEFYYLLGGEKTVVQNYSSTNTYTFKPTETGTYSLYVDVKNASGSSVTSTPIEFEIIDTPAINSASFTSSIASGQLYVNKATTLTAAATGGDGSYTYTFYSQLGTGEKKIISNATDNTATFTPESAGSYTFYVEAKDGTSPNPGTQKITGFKVLDELKAVDLAPAIASPQNRETNIKLTASGSGGKTPYNYEFSYQYNNETVLFQKSSTTKTAVFTPTAAGAYTLSVKITDANNVSVTKDITYVINDNPVVTSLTTNRETETSHYAGDAVTLTAVTDGGTGTITYEFYAKLGSKTILPTTQTGNSAVFTLDKDGTYTFEVKVTDSSGLKGSKTYTGYKVLKDVAGTLKTDKKTGQSIGTTIKLAASGIGGKSPYTYKFYSKMDGATERSVLSEMPTTKTALFKPTVPGNYTLSVDITDSNNVTITKEIAGYVVTNAPEVTLTASPTMDVGTYISEPVALTASVKSGTGNGTLTYEFYYKQGTKEITIPNTANTASFSTTTPGSYTLYVRITDSQTSTTKSIASYKVMALVDAKSLTVTGSKVNKPIKLTASATGGNKSYQYKFYYTVNGTETLITNSTGKTATFTPTVAGSYTLKYIVTDSNGKTDSIEKTLEIKE